MRGDTLTAPSLKSHRVEVNGHSIHTWLDDKPGEPDPPTVVMINGMVIASRAMFPTAELLAASSRVYVPDLPGYGESDKPTQLPDVAGQADMLIEWMDALEISTAALVANSYGCQIAASAAARYPERIDRLVLIGPTSDPRYRAHWQQMLRWQGEMVLEPRDYLAIMASDYWKTGLARALQTYRNMMAHRIEEDLEQVRAPTMIIRGSRDILVSQEWAIKATLMIPDANGRLEIIPDAIHPLNYTDPEELANVVTPFLGRTTDYLTSGDNEQENEQ